MDALPLVLRWLPTLLGYLAIIGLAASLGALIAVIDNPVEAAAVSFAVLLGPALLLLGAARMDLLVILLLVTRISLDALKSGEGSGSASVLVGGLFIFTAVIYLLRTPLAAPVSPFTRALYFLAFAAFASSVMSEHSSDALSAASKVLAGALMFGVLEQLLHRNRALARRIVIAALASAALPIALALQQAATKSGNIATAGFDRVYGTAVTPTSLATYLLPILAVLLAVILHRGTHRRIRRYCLWAVPFPLLALYLTYTRSAWLVLVVGVVYIMWFLRRKWLMPFALGIIMFAVLVPGVTNRFSDIESTHRVSATASANSLDWRLNYWHETISRVGGDWPTGIGLDTTRIIDPSHLPPHNIVVQLYTETGILGCIAGFAVIIGFIRTVRRRRRLAMDWEMQVLAVATGATGLMVLGEGMASNVLTQTIVYWYCAGALAWGLFSADLSDLEGSGHDVSSPVRSSADVSLARRRIEVNGYRVLNQSTDDGASRGLA